MDAFAGQYTVECRGSTADLHGFKSAFAELIYLDLGTGKYLYSSDPRVRSIARIEGKSVVLRDFKEDHHPRRVDRAVVNLDARSYSATYKISARAPVVRVTEAQCKISKHLPISVAKKLTNAPD